MEQPRDEKTTISDEQVRDIGVVAFTFSSPAESEASHIEELSYAEQRRISYKVDRRLVTTLGLLFGVNLMDRGNLASALIAGMQKDLKLQKGTRYSIVVLVFFVAFALFQIPSAALVRRFGPRIFIPLVALCWGILVMCYGFVYDWRALIGLRFLVGIFEAGLLPGSIFLMSLWYSRYEVHKRYSAFCFFGLVGNAFAGVFAYRFEHMAGLGGLAGWRWIFIIEGLLSCIAALVAFVFMVDFPQRAHKSWRFLTEAEAAFIIRRINRDREDANEEVFNVVRFFKPALDPKIWGFGLLFFCGSVVVYAISYYMPVILSQELKFSVGVSQLLSTPPYIFAGIFFWCQGWLGDKYHLRGPIFIWNAIQTTIGLCLLAWVRRPGPQYFGIFLVCAGSNANLPAVFAWQANNIRGSLKRAFCSATLVIFGGLGGIAGSLVFRTQDAPRYLPGIYASLACQGVVLVVTVALIAHFMAANRMAIKGRTRIEGLDTFRYTL